MPCGTKRSSNKNAKSNLTLTPDNLSLITLSSSPSFEHSADSRAYASTGIYYILGYQRIGVIFYRLY